MSELLMSKFRWMSLIGCLCLAAGLNAAVSLPRIFSDHMVLQRGRPVPIWGWAEPGESVSVSFAGQQETAVATDAGKWKLYLSPLQASKEPRDLVVRAGNTITVRDVLVGEVWLASGQSNMEWTFRQCAQEDQVYAAGQRGNPYVRFFHVDQHIGAGVPLDDTIGSWKRCSEFLAPPMHSVSAVGFFFALKLQQELAVPVAILDANWGGQRIESFIPREAYEAHGLHYRVHGGEPTIPKLMDHLQELAEQVDAALLAAGQGRRIPVTLGDRLHGSADNFIYNAMIAPLAPYGLRGAIWYQGESNRGASDYYQKLKALASGWSAVFEHEDLPIHQVQIAPYQYDRSHQANTTLCDTIWKAQYRAAATLPNVGLVPIHDTQIPVNDIHPPHKRPVGERLARLALSEQYGFELPATGPAFRRAVMQDASTVVVEFSGIDQGLSTRDGEAPTWFELSGDGQDFVAAVASVVGDAVHLQVPAGMSPTRVRMGWDEVALPNLCDANGWPAFAFPARRIEGGASRTAYLSDLEADFVNQTHGNLMLDRSASGRALTLNGIVYEKGLGAHAHSDVEYWLGGAYTRFIATVGADDGCGGSVVFKLVCDGEVRFESPLMTRGSEPLPVDVPIAGVDRLQLMVEDGGNGIGCDHANWVNAKIESLR
ncbi:MAG: NPCBM/NEW2 domain-containing protein [Opitutales bacterium]